MQLGTGVVTAQRRPDDPRSWTDIYDEMVDLAETTERVGLDSFWVGEHHFSEDGYMPGVMPSLGAIAGVTDDIELGTFIALAPLYDSVRLAEDCATVDLISNGRLTLGVSIGYREAEFEGFGVPIEERVERLVDAVRVCRAAWSDGPLDYDPEFHPISPDETVTPKPDGMPKILLGGGAKPAVRRAARMGDGWAASAGQSIEDILLRANDIASVREEEGIEGDFQVYVAQNGFIGDSEADAWEKMKEGYLHTRRTYDTWFGRTPSVDESEERMRETRESAMLGTPEEIVDELEDYQDQLGDDIHFIFKTYHPGIGTDTMTEAIERLGEEVAPHVT